MALTQKQISNLRERMVKHKVKRGKAVVEVTAAELHELLDAVDHAHVQYENKKVSIPKGNDPKHLYEVTLVVLDHATGNPDRVVSRVMAACVNFPDESIPVVDGYGIKVKNLTLCNKKNRSSFGGTTICTGYTNKPIPQSASEIAVIRKAGPRKEFKR